MCSGESFHSDRAGTQLSTCSDTLNPHSLAHDDSSQTSWSPFSDSSLFLDIQSCTIWLLQKPKNLMFFSSQPSIKRWKVGATGTQSSGAPWVFPFSPISHFSTYCLKLEMFYLRYFTISWQFLWTDPICYHLLCHDWNQGCHHSNM